MGIEIIEKFLELIPSTDWLEFFSTSGTKAFMLSIRLNNTNGTKTT
jgi:glutamate-1-semialdehyde aminotransferase